MLEQPGKINLALFLRGTQDLCPGKTYSNATFADLNGPAETGPAYATADCDYIYVGNLATAPQPYVYRISIADNSVHYQSIPKRIFNLVVAGDYLWTTEGSAAPFSTIQQIDKKTLTVVWSNATVVQDGRAIAFDGTFVWIADRGANQKLHRINPQTREMQSYDGIVLGAARHFAFDGTYLWLTCSDANAVIRINPSDRSFTVVSGITRAWGVCFDGRSIIVAGETGFIAKVNPTTATIASSTTIPGSSWLCHCSFDGQYVWIADNIVNDVKIIDRDTLAVVGTKSAYARPLGAIFDGKYQWISTETSVRLMKLTY